MIGYEYFIERMKIKKLDKITIILIILFIINIIVLIIAIREMVNGCDSCKMYDASNETSWGVRGLYWHEDKYYCIWAEGRSLSEQKSTEMHEHCHYLVDQDYEHFCVENY